MISKLDKNADRKQRHLRVRKKISGTAAKPRLNIYRSLSHIYAQLVDDSAGKTIASSSTMDKTIKAELSGKTKSQRAKLVGAQLAKAALEIGVESVVFDRGGYLYTGRVKCVADGAREAGLKF